MVETTVARERGIDAGEWLSGAGAGAVGAAAATVVLYATGAFYLSEVTVGVVGVLVMPGAAFGLIYAALARVDRVAALATEPRTGALLGLGYGVLFWLTTIVGGSITPGGLLGGLTFGVVIGLLYARSPYVE